MIQRDLQDAIKRRMFKGKAIILFGARQCGKSTMAELMLKEQEKSWLYMNGDEADVREMLSASTSTKLKAIIYIQLNFHTFPYLQ